MVSVANVVNRLLTRFQPVTTEEFAMKYVGVDLHKQVISVCVVIQGDRKRKVIARRSLRCNEPERIESFFGQLAPFQVVLEASASY